MCLSVYVNKYHVHRPLISLGWWAGNGKSISQKFVRENKENKRVSKHTSTFGLELHSLHFLPIRHLFTQLSSDDLLILFIWPYIPLWTSIMSTSKPPSSFHDGQSFLQSTIPFVILVFRTVRQHKVDADFTSEISEKTVLFHQMHTDPSSREQSEWY